MALAQIIDLDARRRARLSPEPVSAPVPLWCYMWMPVYFWYVA